MIIVSEFLNLNAVNLIILKITDRLLSSGARSIVRFDIGLQ